MAKSKTSPADEIGFYSACEVENGVIVSLKDKEVKELVIPEGVREIPDSLFENNNTLVRLTVNARLERIGRYAFANCTALRSVVFYDRIGVIESEAFVLCKALRKVEFLAEVEKMGDSVFSGCPCLECVKFSDSADGNIERIPPATFFTCYYLKEVKLPPSVEEIGDIAFYECRSLKEINLYDRLEIIGKSAFSGCSSLEALKLKVKRHRSDRIYSFKIRDKAFENCKSLTEFTVRSSGNYKVQIGNEAFKNCTSIEKLVIPRCVDFIGTGAFFGCRSLLHLTLEIGVISTVNKDAFCSCPNIVAIRMPKHMMFIASTRFDPHVLKNSDIKYTKDKK